MFLALFLFCEVKPLKRFTHRLLSLVLCLSLTLGAFVYRPPEAQAIAGVDDAVVIGALLTAFSAGCGLIFANNGMTSNEIAQGMTQKWNEFKDTLSTVPSSFASWLGYDSTEELLASCVIVGPSKMNITRPIARKFAEFTDWLTKDLGVTPGSEPVSVASTPGLTGQLLSIYEKWHVGVFGTSSSMPDYPYRFTIFSTAFGDRPYRLYFSNVPISFVRMDNSFKDGSYTRAPGYYVYTSAEPYSVKPNRYLNYLNFTSSLDFYNTSTTSFLDCEGYCYIDVLTLSDDFSLGDVASDLSVHAPTGVQTLSPDIPAEGTEEAPITISGVGAGAATIEDLLQQILAQVQANTLAPTIEGVDTETGGGTDTEEDAKPYLPYIPRIFGKIKDLPDTLSNIWETIKGIPAAIAEKIGAFFTTLWGWLQSIIDAIKALPAAIAEKIAALFTPDEALVTEITDTFQGKFGFLPTLKQFGNDLFGMTAETEPPVIWVHFENAESNYGYSYGDKQKILDLSWYQKYKANVDTLISGFLWLGFLWLLFKRAAAIIQGGEMLAEYGHDLSQGRRDSNETKFQRYLWKN